MGAIARAFSFDRHPAESRDSPTALTWQSLTELLTGPVSDAGPAINQESAVLLPAVWRAVKFRAMTQASLPLLVYRFEKPRGRSRATDHPLFALLHDEPNPWHTSYFFREMIEASVILHGNGYAAIRRDGAGRPRELWPLIPQRVQPFVTPGMELRYRITLLDGTQETWAKGDIVHVPGLSFDGVSGKSVLGAAREAIGLGLAAQKYGSKYFRAGGRPPGIISVPGQLKLQPEQKANLSADWMKSVGSQDSWEKVPILDRGMTYTNIGIPPEDGQFLETRQFTVSDIARFFDINPHKLYDLSRATFSNIEHQAIEFVVDTVRPACVRWEQELRRKLLTPEERRVFFIEFLVDGLLRGDSAARAAFYASGRQWTWLCGNDIRELENLSDMGPAGEVFYAPINMVNADTLLLPAPDPGAPPPTPDDVRKLAALGLRGVRLRRRIRAAQKPILEEMARSLLKFEIAELRAGVKRLLVAEVKGRRPPENRGLAPFRAWLEEYYRVRGSDITRRALPVFHAYADLSAAAVADEVGSETDGNLSPDLERMLRDYTVDFGNQEAIGSRDQLLALLVEGDEEASAVAVEKRLMEWEERRPGKLAAKESVSIMREVSRAVFRGAGFTNLVWAAGSDACEQCAAMNGKPAGEPPHDGCSCDIIPG